MTYSKLLSATALALGAMAFATPLFAEEAKPAAPVEQRLPLVTVTKVDVRQLIAEVLVTGSLIARDEIVVGSDIDGFKILSIGADIGDTVAQGQVLITLDRSALDLQHAQNTANIANAAAAIAQSQDQIDQANASLVQVKASYDRTKALADKGFSSQDVLDQALSANTRAASQVNAAKNALAAAQAQKLALEAARETILLNISKTQIKAPSAGVVLVRNAKIGSVAAISVGALFTLAKDGLVELEASVPESAMPKLKVGQSVAVTPAGITTPITGSVRLISPKVDTTTRLGLVRIALPKSDVIRVGSFASARIEVAKAEGVAVPLSAVLFGASQPTVQVVVDGKIQTRKIVIGLTNTGYVEALSGVAAGEQVVSRAGIFVRDGDEVKIVTLVDGANG